jgi:hypothetical protein
VGYSEIGYLGYFARRRVIDPLGLVNRGVAGHMASRDFNWAYEHYQPDYIVWTSTIAWGTEWSAWFDREYGLLKLIEVPGWPVVAIYARGLPHSARPYVVKWGPTNVPSTTTVKSTLQTSVSFANAGAATWAMSGSTPVHVGYEWRTGSCPSSAMPMYGASRALFSEDIHPGGSVSTDLLVETPATPGVHCLSFDLVKENIAWFSAQGAKTLDVTVSVTR